MYRNIENSEFKELMKAPGTVVMDVRTPPEIQNGYISGASIFIDINNEPFESRIEQLDKSKNYLVYCRSGVRSARACQLMTQNGFTGSLYNLAHGIIGWDGEIQR
jgi:rhodanese-related sulfurtransferase